MTLSPRTIARSIFRWAWLSCISSALRRTRFMCGSNPSRIPRYPRPPFSSTITFELIRWLRRESGLIIGPRRSHGGGVLKGLREGRRAGRDRSRVVVESIRNAECMTPSNLEEDQTRSSGTRSRKRGAGSRNVLDPNAVAAAMDEPPMPGSRVRATTKHGTLTVDEIAAMQPGMARLMDEFSRRYWVLYYAAKAGNWEFAAYMERESEKILQTASVARPKYRDA